MNVVSFLIVVFAVGITTAYIPTGPPPSFDAPGSGQVRSKGSGSSKLAPGEAAPHGNTGYGYNGEILTAPESKYSTGEWAQQDFSANEFNEAPNGGSGDSSKPRSSAPPPAPAPPKVKVAPPPPAAPPAAPAAPSSPSRLPNGPPPSFNAPGSGQVHSKGPGSSKLAPGEAAPHGNTGYGYNGEILTAPESKYSTGEWAQQDFSANEFNEAPNGGSGDSSKPRSSASPPAPAPPKVKVAPPPPAAPPAAPAAPSSPSRLPNGPPPSFNAPGSGQVHSKGSGSSKLAPGEAAPHGNTGYGYNGEILTAPESKYSTGEWAQQDFSANEFNEAPNGGSGGSSKPRSSAPPPAPAPPKVKVAPPPPPPPAAPAAPSSPSKLPNGPPPSFNAPGSGQVHSKGSGSSKLAPGEAAPHGNTGYGYNGEILTAPESKYSTGEWAQQDFSANEFNEAPNGGSGGSSKPGSSAPAPPKVQVAPPPPAAPSSPSRLPNGPPPSFNAPGSGQVHSKGSGSSKLAPGEAAPHGNTGYGYNGEILTAPESKYSTGEWAQQDFSANEFNEAPNGGSGGSSKPRSSAPPPAPAPPKVKAAPPPPAVPSVPVAPSAPSKIPNGPPPSWNAPGSGQVHSKGSGSSKLAPGEAGPHNNTGYGYNGEILKAPESKYSTGEWAQQDFTENEFNEGPRN